MEKITIRRNCNNFTIKKGIAHLEGRMHNALIGTLKILRQEWTKLFLECQKEQNI